jgi:hypothetical protein
VQLVDPLGWEDDPPGPFEPPDAETDEARALGFLRDVARMSLEGGRAARRPAAASDRIRAAVPERAGVILERLSGARPPYPSLAALRAELAAAAERPTEVGAPRRMAQLAAQAILLSPGLLAILAFSCPKFRPGVFPWDLQVVLAVPLLWIAWASLMRGGLSYPLAGLSLVRGDGRVAGRPACALRAGHVWAPPLVLFAGARYLQYQSPHEVMLAWSLWIFGVLLLIGYVPLALWLPSRGPHDRLSRTVVVPI